MEQGFTFEIERHNIIWNEIAADAMRERTILSERV